MEIQTTNLSNLLLGIIGIIFLPIGLIWSVNTITSVNIEYSFINWLAILFLQLYFQLVIKASVSERNTKEKK